MTASLKTSYDEIPYDSCPLYSAHPNSLAVAGRLRGLATAPPSQCRVLELGCAAGGNLIPMAYGLPQVRFVGVDLSQRQIADGQKVCQQLELANLELHAASIADVDKTWGEFDYIVCHGVFSWVPPAIQQRILWICRNLLAPQGVAYVSYNTNPGWRLRGVVRDLMKYHTARFSDPQLQVREARSILSFIGQAAASEKSFMARIFLEEADNLAKAADCYLYHEHLEDANQPFYFHEFAAQANAAGLSYLGEAWHQHKMDDLPPQIQETLTNISEDIIQLEQYLDFVRCKTFRRTLLCHAEAQFEHAPDPSAVESLLFAPLARPKSQTPELDSDRPEDFLMADGSTATTNLPIWKAALTVLADGFPAAMGFEELLAKAIQAAHINQADREQARRMLSIMLMRGYVTHLVTIQCEPFPLVREISPQPRASKLARVLSLTQSRLPTLRHELAEFSPAERVVLRLVDGTRTKEQIGEAARATVLPLLEAEKNPDSPAPGVADFLEHCLSRFSRAALLEA